MTDTVAAEIEALLASMLKKKLFVALNKADVTSDVMLPFAADHLRYMNDLAERGLLFASGPFIQEGTVVADGLTILKTETIDEARDLMEDEPLIKRGLRRFEIHCWELREGRISVTLNASRSAFELG